MIKYAVVLVALSAIACGGNSSTPASPSPPPLAAANLQASGQGSWVSCLRDDCQFQGEIRNSGPGCANQVRGVVRFLNPQGQQVGSSEWLLAGSQVIRVNETVVYRSLYISGAVIQSASNGTYRSEPAWTNVACP